MQPREILAYALIVLIVLAVGWAIFVNLRRRKLKREIMRGGARYRSSSPRRRKA